MNVHKHMEAIFVVALAVVGFGSMVIDGMPEADAGTSASTPVIRAAAAPGMEPVAIVCAPKAPRQA